MPNAKKKKGRKPIILTPEDLELGARAKEQDEVLSENPEVNALTPKMRDYVSLRSQNPLASKDQLAKTAGYANSRFVDRAVAGKLKMTLKEAGIYEQDIAKAFKEGLSAVKVSVATEKIRDKITGKITKEKIVQVETPDYQTRLATAKILCHLADYFPAKKLSIDHPNTKPNPYDGMSDDDLEKLKDKIKDDIEKDIVEADYTVVETSEKHRE